VVSFLGRLKIS